LTGSTELQRIAGEARALKRAEKPLGRVQQEALSVNDRLTLLGKCDEWNALLIVRHRKKKRMRGWCPNPGAIAAYYNEAQIAPAFAD